MPNWPYHCADENGKPSQHGGFKNAIPVPDNTRKLGKDVMKLAQKRLPRKLAKLRKKIHYY